MRTINSEVSPIFGCDPELFIASPTGEVIGAEKAIPKDGIKLPPPVGRLWGANPHPHNPDDPKVVLDGVQIEIHPRPDTCRARMSNEISLIFQKLQEQLKNQQLQASFSPVVEVSKSELETLSEESRKLGCAPSNNAHDSTATISVDPNTYLTRSAGGHIHIDLRDPKSRDFDLPFYGVPTPNFMPIRTELVPVLDVILGNTCVMIDRDPNAAKRREVYGRAGEFRLPSYGLEYRTLSNFWLRHYCLMSMVFGLARLSVNMWYQSTCNKAVLKYEKDHGHLPVNNSYYSSFCWDPKKQNFKSSKELPEGSLPDHVGDLMSRIDIEKVVRAINLNDLQLAKENWAIVKDFLNERLALQNESMAICRNTLPDFQYFLDKIESNGLNWWFPDDPMTHWIEKPDGHGHGFETFLTFRVHNSRVRSETMKALWELRKRTKTTIGLPPVEKEYSDADVE